jgi:hypothetical protein
MGHRDAADRVLGPVVDARQHVGVDIDHVLLAWQRRPGLRLWATSADIPLVSDSLGGSIIP